MSESSLRSSPPPPTGIQNYFGLGRKRREGWVDGTFISERTPLSLSYDLVTLTVFRFE